MSEGVVIPLDVDDAKAKGKIARLKAAAGQAGKEYAKAGTIAARVGGAGGGMMGRMTGGFSMGMGAGIVGGAMAVGGGLAGMLVAARDRVIETARMRAEAGQDRANTVEKAGDAVRKTIAGALSKVQSIRRFVASTSVAGSSVAADKGTVSRLSRTYNISADEAADVLTESRSANVEPGEVAMLVASGDFDAASAAESIRGTGSSARSYASKKRISVDKAGAALSATRAVPVDTGWGEWAKNMDGVLSGAAKSASEGIALDNADPVQNAIDEIKKKAAQQREVLIAAGHAQLSFWQKVGDGLAGIWDAALPGEQDWTSAKRKAYRDVNQNLKVNKD